MPETPRSCLKNAPPPSHTHTLPGSTPFLGYLASPLTSSCDPSVRTNVCWCELEEGGSTAGFSQSEQRSCGEPSDIELKPLTHTHTHRASPDTAPLGTRLLIRRCQCSVVYHRSRVKPPPPPSMQSRAEQQSPDEGCETQLRMLPTSSCLEVIFQKRTKQLKPPSLS